MVKEYVLRLAIGAAELSVLIAIVSSAHATPLSYAQWDALSLNERNSYISGAFNGLVGISSTPAGMHYYRCVRDKKIMDSQLADGVRAVAMNKPELQALSVQAVLLYYLNRLCGEPPAN